MTRRLLSALGLTALALQAGFCAAKKDAAPKPVDEVPEYKFDGSEAVGQFADNATFVHPKGWYRADDLCIYNLCVYSNREVANGRGFVLVSTIQGFEKVKGLGNIGLSDTSDFPKQPLWEEKETAEKGLTYMAKDTVKRGTKVFSIPPVIGVHMSFFNSTGEYSLAETGQERILQGAVKLLPPETQARFWKYAQAAGLKKVRDVVWKRPLEANFGLTWQGQESGYVDEKHLMVYPEALAITHHCRPNTAFHIDSQHSFRAAVARKLAPGEEITVSYFPVVDTRANRQIRAEKWFGKPCTCPACTGDLNEITKSDARIEEIVVIEKKLNDQDSTGVSAGLLARLLSLYQEERLEVAFSYMYGLLAHNYNQLGYERRTVKYGNLAVQSGILEYGPEHNDVIAWNILTKDPTGHYSWRQRVKKKAA